MMRIVVISWPSPRGSIIRRVTAVDVDVVRSNPAKDSYVKIAKTKMKGREFEKCDTLICGC